MVESVSGKEAPLTLTLHGLQIDVCAKGHRQLSHGKVLTQAVLRLLTASDEGNLPVSAESGFWRRRALCIDCGAELDKTQGVLHTFRVEVPIPDAQTLWVDLTAPVYRCRACGKEHMQAQRDMKRRVSTALLGALTAAGIASEVPETIDAN